MAELPAEFLQALVAQSRDLLAVTDSSGAILWSNERFSTATGALGRPEATLLDFTPPGAAGSASRLSFARMLSTPGPDTGTIELRGPAGESIWVEARSSCLAGCILWTLADITQAHGLAERASRQEELLETAQEFGRLGIWERQIPSGEGHWDKHVFRFWGMDLPPARPASPTRSSASTPKTGRACSIPSRHDAPAATRSASGSCSPTAGRAGSTPTGRSATGRAARRSGRWA